MPMWLWVCFVQAACDLMRTLSIIYLYIGYHGLIYSTTNMFCSRSRFDLPFHKELSLRGGYVKNSPVVATGYVRYVLISWGKLGPVAGWPLLFTKQTRLASAAGRCVEGTSLKPLTMSYRPTASLVESGGMWRVELPHYVSVPTIVASDGSKRP